MHTRPLEYLDVQILVRAHVPYMYTHFMRVCCDDTSVCIECEPCHHDVIGHV